MGRQVFTAGEILTAAKMNDLGDQTVMVFDDATARATAIPTPVEGMVTYLKDDDEVTVFDGSAFKAVGPGQILQVVSVPKVDVESTSSNTFVDIPGLTLSITPSSATSKVMIFVQLSHSNSLGNTEHSFNLIRNSTNLFQSTGGISGNSTIAPATTPTTPNIMHSPIMFLDSPATTSAVTYKMAFRTLAGVVFLNRRGVSGDIGSTSSITAMEVAG